MSHVNEPSNLDDGQLEAQLAVLGLPPLAIDRDRVMYLAGMQAARAEGRVAQRAWPALAMLSTAASLTLAVLLAQQPTAIPMPQTSLVVTQPTAPPAKPIAVPAITAQSKSYPTRLTTAWEERLAASDVLGWRTKLDKQGLDVVLTSRTPAEPSRARATVTPTSRELLDELLRTKS